MPRTSAFSIHVERPISLPTPDTLQSHLTREARDLAGLTPSNIREQLTL
jgi:hypothetical protein